jgi:hypothetical protein
VDAPGYRPHVQDLVLDLNQEIRVEVPLLPGKTSEQVTVTATRSLLRPDSSTVGGVIDNRQVQGLPLDGRDFYELSLLLPGVVPAAEGSAASVRGSFAININGAREDANDFLLDGVYNGDPKLNGTRSVRRSMPSANSKSCPAPTTPPSDAMAAGKSASCCAPAATSSTARPTNSSAMPSSTRAIISRHPAHPRPRTSATSSAAPSADRSSPTALSSSPTIRAPATVPASRKSPMCPRWPNALAISRSRAMPAIDPYTGAPFPNNIIPSAYLDPTGTAIAALYPAPNRNVPNQNYVSSPDGRTRADQFDVRVDHRWRPRRS